MTTKKAATKVEQNLVGEGRMSPTAANAILDAAYANRPVGLTAANPGGIANGSKLLLMDYLFGAVAPATAATTYYVGLGTGTFTGGTSDIALLQGTFTSVPEVVSGASAGQWSGYARVSLTNTIATATWAAATAVATTQVVTKTTGATGTISFTTNATITTAPGPNLTYWFITTVASGAPTAAQMIAVGNLTSGGGVVVNGASVSFAPAALTITLT